MFNHTLAEVITVLGMCAATYSSRLLGYLVFNEKPRNSPCVSVGMDSGTERQLGPVCFL